MENNTALAIVIPVYNEADRVTGLLTDWKKVFDGTNVSYKIILIDDGSRDSSLSLLKTLQATDPTLEVYTQPNAGHGPAILKGYALSRGAEWVFQIDSDHQLDTAAFLTLWAHRESHDLLVAERAEKNASLSRQWISRASVFIVQRLFGKLVSDVNSPYRLMRCRLLSTALDTIPGNSFAPNVLLTAWFIRNKTRIFTTTVGMRIQGTSRKSTMSWYILRGALRSGWQTLLFHLKL
jgi:glycosyltransferase involved in cell wall biosynthesis